MSENRSYKMRKRAQSQEETRLRIVEATMQLHEELGPAATTISAIAERAGVQRLTVYRHFEDDTAVFQACTQHWLSLNPPPDLPEFTAGTTALTQVLSGLELFLAYYKRTQQMWAGAYRDLARVPALHVPMQQFEEFLNTWTQALVAPLQAQNPAAAKNIYRTVRHLLSFPAWQQFQAQKLSDQQIRQLAEAWLQGLLISSGPASH